MFKSDKIRFKEHKITVYGTLDNPLFKVMDISKILNIPDIKSHIKKFDSTEKVVLYVQSKHGKRKRTLFTIKGFTKFLLEHRFPTTDPLYYTSSQLYNNFSDYIFHINKMMEIDDDSYSDYDDVYCNCSPYHPCHPCYHYHYGNNVPNHDESDYISDYHPLHYPDN